MGTKHYSRLHWKNCKFCNDFFFSKNHTKVKCKTCKKQPKFKQVFVKILCSSCSCVIREETKNITKTSKENKKIVGLCELCKKLSNVKRSIAKRGEKNPNYDPLRKTKRNPLVTELDEEGNLRKFSVLDDGRLRIRKKRIKKIYQPKKDRKLVSAALRLRMRENNPMFRRETLDKVKLTRRQREYNYKTGPAHHLYKGNREPTKHIRDALVHWKRNCLIAANFKCELCQSNEYLEIHHIEPFREILQRFVIKPLKDYDQTSEEFEKLKNDIVRYHESNEVGQVLCLECHVKEDEHRNYSLPYYVHKKYIENKENNKKTI